MALTANQDWLYKQMSGMNVDLGSEEQFAQAMQDENNRQWVYDQAGKMGIDLGTPEQFASAMQMPAVAEVQQSKGGVSGGSLLSEQEELARQNAILGVTNDPNHPFVEGEKLRISDVQRPQDYEGESSFYGLSDEELNKQIGEYDQRRTAAQEAMRQQQRSRKRSFAEQLAAIDNPALQPAQDQIEVNNVRLNDEDEERYARLQQEKVWRERNSESYQELGDAILETRKLVNSLRDQNGRNIDSGGASAYLDKAIELYQAPSKYGQQSGFKNWAEGLGAQLSDYDTYTLGVTEAFRAGNMVGIVKKLNKGEDLTDQEQANLQSFLLLSMVEQAREQDLSTGYKIGKQSAESIPFMLEMLATAGLGAAGEKALVKSIVKSGNRHLAERVARMFGDEYMVTAARKKSGKIVKDIALNRVEQGLLERVARQVGEDVLMTAAMPTTWASVNNDRVNEMLFDDDHDYGFMDFMRSFTSATLETGTERWGGKIVDKTLNKVMPLDKIWGKQKWGKLLSNDFIHSPFGETGEEYINAIASAVRSVNPLYSDKSNEQLRAEAEHMFTPAGFAQTFLTVLPMSAIGGTVNVGISKYKLSQYQNGKSQLTGLLTGLGATTEQAENIIRQIESSEDTSGFAGKVAETERILLYNYQVDHPNATKDEYEAFKKQVDKTVGAYFKGAAYLNELTGELRDAYAAMPEEDKQRCRDAWNEYVVAEFENKVPEDPAQETTPLSPAAAEHQRAVDEVTQAVQERTHGNGYIYPVAMPGNAEKTGYIVGEVVPVIDESNPEQLKIENDDVVTVKWSDGTVTQERARDLDLTGAPMMAQQAIDIEVENQMYGYTQQRIQNGEQPVLMRNGEGILEGFFPTEGGLLEDQNGVQYTPEQLAEQGWQETKPVLFVNDQQQIAALDNGDGTYTQVDALGNPIAEPMSAEAFREQGFAMVPLEEEQPKSQAPVEAPVVEQASVEQAPDVQQPEVQEPAAPVVPNIETMSAADYAGAAVEYMGSREYVDEYLDGEIKKVQQQLGVANRKKVGNVTDMADFKAKKDAIEAEKKALQARLDKLTEAREKAKSYLSIAEREARAKAEAERRAAEEAARIAREQAAAAEAARLEQERIDREMKKGVPDFSEDNDRDARARGFHVVNGQVIRRQTPLTPIAVGKPVMVQFAKGKNGEAEAVNVLININKLQPSHINGQRNPAFFVSEMQPKDRRDQVSKVTAQEAAQNIHPGEIIGGTTAYVGSPVVLSTGEVVQGNWRGNVLIEMYRNYPESVAKYKQALIDNAVSLNLTEQDIERIKNEDVISVRMLKDLPIEQAIQLGQKKATDLETGGVQLIDPQVTATQLGDKIERFANTLLKSDDEEASLADLTLRNGKPALDFLQSLNIISPAQMQSAFDSRGNMTAETKAALQGVLKQVLFKDAKNDNLPIMFDDIPLTAQKAILQTIVRDIKTTNPDAKLTPHIQEAIGALYRALHQSTEVKNSRNEQETRVAMHSWAIQMQFPSDFDAENFVPSEIFSNFALELATLFKYGKQTEVAKKLNAYYDAVQGTTGGLFGDTPAIPYKEAIKQIFGIDYKSVDEILREKHRKELTDYLNTIADEGHPFELYGNDNVIEILKGLGANDVILARAQELIDSGESILGIKGNGGRLLLNSDSLADKEAARSKYVHERQHLLTTPEQKERVLKAASVDELKLIVKIFTNGSDFYDRAGEDEIADEFISYSMEEAYAVESDEELESILRAAGANDELINIIKSINNEQRENDERLGQSERLGNARRHTDVDTDSDGHREQGGRDQGTESGVLEPKGARLDTRGELGERTGGENQGSTEGAGLSEVGTKGVSGEEAGGAGDNAGIAGENQGSSGVGQERGLGEVAQLPTENRETTETKASGTNAAEIEIGGALVDRLGDMGLNVSTDLAANQKALKEAKADKSEAGTIHYFKTPSGKQYGFAYKGKVYLDPTKIDAELPIHEYGHLWAEALRRLNPENWQRVVETIKADKDAWAFVRELRPELTDENEIAEEVIATFSGKNGAEKMRAEYERMHGKDADYKSKWGNIFKNISKAIQDFWKAVGDFLNIKYESAEQVYDQVLKDFVDNMNPWKRVSDFLRQRDAEYVQAAESGDIKTATNIFYEALKENIGNGITPYMSVGTYNNLRRLAKGVKTRDAALIKEAADLIAPLIPDNAVLIPAPSHSGTATDMLDLAKAIAEVTGSEVADVLRSAPRESQYQAKKTTGVPMASKQLGIAVEGDIPADKTPIIIDNVVDSGNTAEACVQAVGKGVVVTLADSAEQYGHAASLKSAAPVLRDKDGKVIPLSKRFDLSGSRYLGRRMYLRPDDLRLSVSGTQTIPVGKNTLVGLHNISAEKLRKAIKMGGLANPSTAVIDIARQNHEDYGAISLIMPSRLVDSDTGRNAGTFTGDIWSPTYPHVEKQMSDKGDEAYYAAITKAFGDNAARRPILSRAKLDFDDYLDSGNIRAGLAYWYLLEKGIEPGDVYFQSGISEDIKERFRPLFNKGILDLTKEDYKTLLSLIAEQQGKTAEDMLQDAQESKARYQQTIDDPEAKQFYKKIAQQAIDEIDLYGVRYNVLSNGYHAMERAIREDGKIDLNSTLIAAQDIVQTQYQADFDKWISDMDERFDISEVLFEDYDRDGNRKYKPHTLANVSRMMNKEDLQNAGDHGGLGATRGILVKRLETLADIRAEKGRLRPGTEEDIETEEWNKMQDEWFNKVLNPLSDMQKISDNPFSNVGYAETRLQEALRTKDPIATLNKEYRYHIDKDSQWAKDLADMVERVKNLPTKYFETKFRRPVYLNEFANAVVPNDLPQDLRAGLESAGLRLFGYDPNAQGSRRDATLEATAGEGIRFAISGRSASTGSSKRSNRDIEALRRFESVRPEIAKEMESIKNNALNDGTFMKAPNGKPSRLNERQWLQVRTRAFKRWFGDWENDPENASKVLDENGEPMVAKHGTPFTFTTFDKSKQQQNDAGWLGRGFYFFTKNDDYAAGYAQGGQVINAFLNIKDPYYATYADMERLAEMDSKEESERFTQGLIDEGYDGVYFDANLNGEWVAFNPNQIKSATDNNGDFSEENDDIRFSISNQNNDIFYSNAERAVEGIKQEKATPEQWRAMIEKAGGLKSGEDKWIGLSDWLAQQRPTVTPQEGETRSQFVERAAAENKRFTLSKQDLLDYIREHKIQIEETHYQEEVLNGSDVLDLRDEIYDKAYDLMSEARDRFYDMDNEEESMQEAYEYAMGELKADYGDDVEYYYNIDISGDSFSIVRTGTDRDFYEFALDYYHDVNNDEVDTDKEYSPINSTRLRYTTEGLQNKREIALVVPTIESWNQGDEVHFGDAGEGRAIAWVRFGDTEIIEKRNELEQAEKTYGDFIRSMVAKYGNYYERVMSDSEHERYYELGQTLASARRISPSTKSKVLVINEIQSKRHQSGREQGYQEHIDRPGLHVEEYIPSSQNPNIAFARVTDENGILYGQVQRLSDGKYRPHGSNLQPIGWTDYNTEEEAFNIVKKEAETLNEGGVPEAPFEKNWHELAMKRVLRFAAENGYDKVAWTTGDQQARRYDLGKQLDELYVYYNDETGLYDVSILPKGGDVDSDVETLERGLDDEGLKRTIGKDLYNRVMEEGKQSGWDLPVTLADDDLVIGTDGMKGFYDDILPRFMKKYGKKWGVQVGDVTMPDLEEGYQTMHAIDINDAMRESVMEGQPMFSISGRGVNGTIKPQEGETRSQYIARVAETVKNMTPRNTTIDDAIRFSITVNHNSPYLLKKADGSFVDPETGERLGFDHRFMGKGEGGQAHGWGSYFSVNDIRSYGEGYGFSLRDIKDAFNTSRWQSFGVGDAFDVAKGYLLEAHSEKAPSLRKWLEDRLAQKQELLKNYEGKVANTAEEDLMVFRAEADVQYIPALLRDMVNDIDTRNRHHYDVEIPDNDGTNYFEEDQPLTQEQIDRLRKAAKETGIPKFLETISGFLRFAETNPEEYPFRKFYSDITDFQYGYPRETISNFLKDAGFVGIHYDGRRDGECYVIFDENDAKITNHIRFAVSKNANNSDNNLDIHQKIRNFAAKFIRNGKGFDENNHLRSAGRDGSGVLGEAAGRMAAAADRSDIRVYEPQVQSTDRVGDFLSLPRTEARERTEAESERLIAVAKSNNQFVERKDLGQYGDKLHGNTRESTVFVSPDRTKHIKVKDPFALTAIKGNYPEDAIYEHLIHNLLFPDTRYTFMGISEDLGDVRIILSQETVDAIRNATDKEVDERMRELGLRKVDPYTYENEQVRVTDVTGDNALVDKDGNVRFIDPVISLKVPARTILDDIDESDSATEHIRFSINSGKQKIWIQWHEDNPHPKYEEGEGLEHYRERLERWEASFNEMRSKTKDMPESEPEQPKSEPQFETAEQKAEREEIYPSYMSPKEIVEKAIALNSQRMSPDAVILRHNVINNMRKLREQIRRLREAETSEVGTITSEIEQGVRSRSVALRAEYEKSAKMITDMAKALFRGKVFQGMTDQDFSKMLTNIRDASTKFDLQKNIEIMEDIVQRVQGRYLRLSQEAVSQAASITLQRRNQSGVDIGKRVDPLHFVMISQFNALRNTNLTKINTTLADLNSQIKEEISDTELEILSAKIAGAERVKTYQEELNRLQTDLDQIDSDIAQLDKYVSRNELKGNKRKEFMEHRRSLMSERAELIDELILLNDNTVEQLSSITRDGHSKFLERIRQKQEHKIEILRMMARDLHGIRSDEGAKEGDKGGLKDNYLSPLRTFTHELRKFGTHSAGGEGYLYSYFAPLAHDARTNYLQHVRERMEILDNKARELFGEKATWNSVMKSVSNQLTEVEYKWRNVGADNTTVNSAGVQKSVKKPKVKYLTNGQIMYIYMVNKMTDGKAKLEQMGIDDATVAELKAKLPKELVQLADWLQEEYFPMTRKRYNETNIYLFDTPMAEIANYVPLKISGNAIDPKVDVGTGDMHMLPSNIVGNAISRTYNKKPIDIENTDAMDLVVQNMLTMEHWSAYAELITDLNTLLNSASFKHRIEQMNPNNYDNFFKTAQLAVDQYKPEVGPADKFVTGLTRFVATSKISLRWWTALKQSLSAISPLSEADPEFHKQYANAILHSKDSFQWALENLPIFRERWESKQGGNEKLNIAEINSKSQRMQDMLEWAQENLKKYGISANAFVDAIVCANMAKAQYEAKKKYYTERGYSPEAVERLAKWKADEIYNETQQSSEGAYISAMQRDRTFIASSISLFNNSSMAYNRKNAEAIREAYKIAVRDKQEFVEFRKEQLMKDGIAEDQAAKFAETDYKRARTHAIADMAINGYFIQFVWNVGGKAFKTLLAVLPFLFFGDDDEKKRAKEELLADLKKDAIVSGIQPIRGLPFGASFEAFLNVVYDRLSDEENRRYMSTNEIAGRASSNIHPAIQDVSKLLSTLTKDEVDKLNFASYLVNLATSTGTSVDAQTVANELWALEDVIERSFQGKLTWSDIRNDVAILLNVPPSQIEYMILQPRKNETRDEFVQRYTEYIKLKKYGLFTPVVKTDDVELSNSQEDRVYNAFYNY